MWRWALSASRLPASWLPASWLPASRASLAAPASGVQGHTDGGKTHLDEELDPEAAYAQPDCDERADQGRDDADDEGHQHRDVLFAADCQAAKSADDGADDDGADDAVDLDVILSFVQGGAVANAWRTTLQGRRHVGHPRSQIHLHPAICALHGGEAAAPVDLVRIPGGEKETCYTVGRKILNDALYQPSIQPSSAVWLSDENVTDPGKRGRVGDNAREGRLLFLGVHGVGTRSGD